jgi:lipoprotein NlpD
VTDADVAPPAVPAPATTTNTPVVVAGKPAESVVPVPVAVPPPGTPNAATPAPAPAPVENPSAATPIVTSGASRSAGGIAWRWPADGTMLKKFSSADAIPGIEIGGKAGDPVRSAADGVVVYSGNGLVGYGELVIIKHSDSFLSAYGHNRKRLVKEGEKVKAGQTVAEMGSSGATRDELQFQIRRDGNPVDPLQYLPAK